MRGDIRRMIFAAASLCFCAALIAVSCGPLGDDDDEPALGESDNSDVVRSTYTPTVPGSTPESVQTHAAVQTAAVMTATELIANPPPATAIAGGNNPSGTSASGTPSGDGSGSSGTAPPGGGGTDDNPITPDTPSDLLEPPSATLSAAGNQVDGGLGPYAWQWDDPQLTYFEVPASPLMQVTDVALTMPAGAEAEITFAGDALQEPPDAITLEIYDFDENTATPVDQSGNTMGDGGLAFAPKVDPITTLQPDPANPVFTADFAPGHYVLYMRAGWPPPPNPTKPGSTIYVTYTFNIIVE